ncbi:MAG: acylphosphatase [Lachnospiraceae bacterium]|nr:acylphosphatase [Lachnospiraceae bacterium]
MSKYTDTIIRKYLKICGFVQGVGFRYRAEHAANIVGATGWVRNDPDGAVSMEIQGTEEQIDKVIIMIEQGNYISIERMDSKTIQVLNDEHGFHTRSY